MQNEIRAFRWNDTIENDGKEYSVLPEGEANFVVTNMEQTKNKDGYDMAVLTINLWTEFNQTNIKEYLVLNSASEWKLCEFFKGIGQRKHGEPLQPRWNEVPGSTGRCKIKIHHYTKDNGDPGTINKIEKFLEPVDQGLTQYSTQPMQTQPQTPEPVKQYTDTYMQDSGDLNDIPF